MFSFQQPPVPLTAGLLAGVSAAAPAVPGTEFPANQSITGKIKAWYEDKGFGFITPDLPGPDVFLHKNQLTDVIQLAQGTPVSFQARFNPARGKYEVTSCQSAGVAPDVAKGTAPATGGWAVQDNLFIAGLPITATEEFVKDYFAKYGMVAQCKVLPDQPGKLDRAALVRFADAGQARWLVDNLNGTTPEGLSGPLTVRFAGDRPGGLPGQNSASFGPVGAVATAMSPYGVPSPVVGSDAFASALTQLIPGLAQPQLLPGLQTLGNLGHLAPAPGIGGTQQASSLGQLGAAVIPSVGTPQAFAAQPLVPQPVAINGVAPVDQGGDLWLQATDPATGRPYYYHALTREVRWDKPA
mmetsp:Transcript_15545/g.24671  ORF Transcript_15545/g.24671 Transcript_15545/m.24671 type:complete len:354 (-) Transcript_15545:55-1116(-)